MTPNLQMPEGRVPPLVAGLFALRPDVKSAFPDALCNHPDPGLAEWIGSSGLSEAQLQDLVSGYWDYWCAEPSVSPIVSTLERRLDVVKAFPDHCTSQKDFEGLAEWCRVYGTKEEGLSDGSPWDISSDRPESRLNTTAN